MINYSDLHYYGKPITELSKEELIKIIVHLLKSNEEINENFMKLNELNMRILDQNIKLLKCNT